MKITIEIPDGQIEEIARSCATHCFSKGDYGVEREGVKLVRSAVLGAIEKLDLQMAISAELKKQVDRCVTEVCTEELRRRVKREIKTLTLSAD